MIFFLATLISGIFVSSVAAYYSIVGMMAVFSAASVSIAIMMTSLELGKYTSALWLHRNWNSGKNQVIKSYLTGAVLILMIITSMGIFGFLSKAHLDQTQGVKDNTAKIEHIEHQIDRIQDQVENQEAIIDQLDAALAKYVENNYITRALEARSEQRETRDAVRDQIAELRAREADLRDQRFVLASQIRELELEVGPILYVADLIFEDRTRDNLDRAVRYVIIALIFVFDPLAICLLIASQISFGQMREKERDEATEPMVPPEEDPKRETESEKIIREKRERQKVGKDDII